jgi:hypothetical protein
MKRIPARASETLRAMIDQAGPVSAATRALLWLGAGASGLSISSAGRREIAALLIEDLDANVIAALQQLYDRLGNGGAASETRGDTLRSTERLPAHAAPVATGAATAFAIRGTPAMGEAGYESGDSGDPFLDTGREFSG